MTPVNDSGSFSLRKADGKSVKMLFTGDLAATEITRERYVRREFDAMFGAIRPHLAAADFRVIDVEIPIVEKGAATAKLGGQHGLHSPREVLDGLVYLNTNIANLANNHVTDQGPAGVKSTLDLLHGAGIQTFGAGMDDAEAGRMLLVERNGVRVGLLGFCQDENNIAGPGKPGANLFTPERLIESVPRWRSEADVLVLNVHAGSEHTPIPDPYRVEAFRAASAAGADIVIGHHPHQPQGVEVRDGRLIAYSMGNFFFYLKHMRRNPMAAVSFALELELDRKGVVGGRFIPHRTTEDKEDLQPLEGAERLAMLRRLQEISALLDDDKKRDRIYKAGCWMLWKSEYIPWVVERVKKSTLDENLHFMAGWLGNLSGQPHREVIRAVFAMEKSGGVNEADLREVERLAQLPK